MENPRARWAKACPVRPKPTMTRRGVMHVPAQHHERPPHPSRTGADERVTLGDPPGRGYQRECGVRGGLGQHTKACCRPAAALGACLQVGVVKAHGVVRHDLELGPGGPQQLLVDAIGEQRMCRFEGPQAA